VPDKKDDKPDSLDRVRGDRSLARRSGFMARRVRELAQKARELKLADEIEVVFPDKNLEATVREALEKPEGPLTMGDVKRLAKLDAWELEIGDLSGIEHATNLTVLGLWDNEISDVSPLASLTNLTSIRLSMSRSPQVGGVGMLIDGWLTSVTRRTMSTFRILADAA
jgi:hypothetical protein